MESLDRSAKMAARYTSRNALTMPRTAMRIKFRPAITGGSGGHDRTKDLVNHLKKDNSGSNRG